MGFIYNKSFYRGNTKLKVVFRVVFCNFSFFSLDYGCVWIPAKHCHAVVAAAVSEANKMAATVVARVTECMAVGILRLVLIYSQTKLQPSICGGHMHDVAKCGVEPNTPVVHCC